MSVWNNLNVKIAAEVTTAFAISICSIPGQVADAKGHSIQMVEFPVYDVRPRWHGELSGMWCSSNDEHHWWIGATNYDLTQDKAVGERGRINQHTIVKTSSDAGRSWDQRFIANVSLQDADPACVVGEDGVGLVGAMHRTAKGWQGYNLWRTGDFGVTWSQVLRQREERFFDRAYLAIDQQISSKFRGTIYLAAFAGTVKTENVKLRGEVVVYRSSDGGRSFAQPAIVQTGVGLTGTGLRGDGTVHMGNGVIRPNGDFVLGWTEGEGEAFYGMFSSDGSPTIGPTRIRVAVSKDGGISFSTPINVAAGRHSAKVARGQVGVGKWYPNLATDLSKSRFRGRLYIAWADIRGLSSRIVVSRSDDIEHWSAARVISGAARSEEVERRLAADEQLPLVPQDRQATIAVNNKGVVGVVFYRLDRVAMATFNWRAYFAYSRNGGDDWSEPRPLSVSGLATRRDPNKPFKILPFAPDSMTPLIEQGEYPTCNFTLTTDAEGQFRAFYITGDERRLVYRSTSIHVE